MYNSLYNREIEIMQNILRNGGSEMCDQFPFINQQQQQLNSVGGSDARGGAEAHAIRDDSLFPKNNEQQHQQLQQQQQQHNYNSMTSSKFGGFPIDTFNLGIPKTINTSTVATAVSSTIGAASAAVVTTTATTTNTQTTNNQIESPLLSATNYHRGMIDGSRNSSSSLTLSPHSMQHPQNTHHPQQNHNFSTSLLHHHQQHPTMSSSFGCDKDNSNYCISDSSLNEMNVKIYSPKSMKTLTNCDRGGDAGISNIIETNNHLHQQQHHHQLQQQQQYQLLHHHQQQHNQHYSHQIHHHNHLNVGLSPTIPTSASSTNILGSNRSSNEGDISGGIDCIRNMTASVIRDDCSSSSSSNNNNNNIARGDSFYHKKSDENNLMNENKSIINSVGMSENKIIFYEKTNNLCASQNNGSNIFNNIDSRGSSTLAPSSSSIPSSNINNNSTRHHQHDDDVNEIGRSIIGDPPPNTRFLDGNDVLTTKIATTITLETKRDDNETDIEGDDDGVTEGGGGGGAATAGGDDSDGENNFQIL